MEKNELPCWAVFAIIAGLALIGVFIWQIPKNSQEWAAWVAAIGSLTASITAVGVAYWLDHIRRHQAMQDGAFLIAGERNRFGLVMEALLHLKKEVEHATIRKGASDILAGLNTIPISVAAGFDPTYAAHLMRAKSQLYAVISMPFESTRLQGIQVAINNLNKCVERTDKADVYIGRLIDP